MSTIRLEACHYEAHLMVNMSLKYVVEDIDRHGNVRVYFRRLGFAKIRLRGLPGSEQFQVAYAAALAKTETGAARRNATEAERGSMAWLSLQYYQSADFRRLDARTQRVRRLIIDGLCDSGAGPLPYNKLTPLSILKWRDAKADRPEAANSLIKALRQLYAFAIEYRHATKNPAKDVKYLRSDSDGFHSWTEEEIARFEACHPVGSKARLALALLLYTGQRRSDIVLFGRQHLRGEWLHFTQQKNRARKPITLAVPVLPELQRIIEETPWGALTFLVTEFGRPFTANGFGNRFRKWCDEAGLPPECSAHGLRKAAATRLAEAGASELEIRAITGHQTSREVSRYTKAASQKVLAKSGMAKLTGNKTVPLAPMASVPPKKAEGTSI
jgi:integrase